MKENHLANPSPSYLGVALGHRHQVEIADGAPCEPTELKMDKAATGTRDANMTAMNRLRFKARRRIAWL